MVLHSKVAVKTMSESVYVGLCHKIGTPQEVAFRREISDVCDLFENQLQVIKSGHDIDYLSNELKVMVSGSHREGFRLNGSDIDRMQWINYRVIWNFVQSQFYNIQRQKVILCDSSESPPGFTLLLLPTKESNCSLFPGCVKINGRIYISSSKFREMLLGRGCTLHGPCSTSRTGNVDYDYAHCFASDFWPPSATSWIYRCHQWPPVHVVNEIVSNGCHFVAIGHRLGNHADDEWRISFSQAENRLVYSMNHTQFLTYGLLKLFLKEIINEGLREEDKLLCSYHMKTVVFWAIQQNVLPHLGSQNILACFWVCFKLLLKCVYDGVCPNFFIPLNNMFLGKIHGGARTDLFKQLYVLYMKGIALLLNSPSIRSCIIDSLCNPGTTVCTAETALISVSEFNSNLVSEIESHSYAPNEAGILKCVINLKVIEQFIGLPLTWSQLAWLQRMGCKYFQDTAFNLYHKYKNTASNKSMYVVDKIACRLLKLAAKFGVANDVLYISMYYYKTFRYRKALFVLQMVKLIENIVYFDLENSLSSLFRNTMRIDVFLKTDISYIDELILIQEFAKKTSEGTLDIPGSVILHMLEFLCFRNVDSVRARESLDSLQVVVQGVLGDSISWEILGICQQIAGNIQAALYSYQMALCNNDDNDSIIHTVAIQRIQELQNNHYIP
nr:uncharacterized protein LOC117686455 [Crassostrea gigas]